MKQISLFITLLFLTIGCVRTDSQNDLSLKNQVKLLRVGISTNSPPIAYYGVLTKGVDDVLIEAITQDAADYKTTSLENGDMVYSAEGENANKARVGLVGDLGKASNVRILLISDIKKVELKKMIEEV